MKIEGMSFDGPKSTTVVIPLGDDEIVFSVTPVLSTDEFDELYPRPEPPKGRDKKGKEIVVHDNQKYLMELDKWADAQMNWIYIKALEKTEGLTWDTIDMLNPETFSNFHKELEASGMSGSYIEAFKVKIIQACGLDPSRIDEATERFLAGQGQE